MSEFSIIHMNVDKIRPTEKVDARHASSLAHAIQVSSVWTHPLLVEETVFALMDGHHRFEAARKIGLQTVPVALLSYDDDRIQLQAWRAGEYYTPDNLKDIALSGELLPEKSTRHLIFAPMPRCRVPLDTLMDRAMCGTAIDASTPQPTRAQLLAPYYHAFAQEVGIRTPAGEGSAIETAGTQAPHVRLRQMLESDPAMAALLPVAPGRIALGGVEHAPFYLKSNGLLMVPPTLLDDPAALAIATRWGLETSHAIAPGADASQGLALALRHGAELIAMAPAGARNLLLETLPEQIGRELFTNRGRSPSPALKAWQAGRIEGMAVPPGAGTAPDLELSEPLEKLLMSGGDSRLAINPATGFNHYGVPPRPRPEAAQFSSSTASAISDYGFMFCDVLRRDLLTAMIQDNETDLRRRAINATGRAICTLLGLAPDAADVAIAPSGTDTELLTVMIALAGAAKRPLTNLLISPEETGRGVKFAGAGCYFDEKAATGSPIQKNVPVWPEADISVREIAIRGPDGTPRRAGDLDREFLNAGIEALDAGHHVLAHVLVSSKTGLSAPSFEAVETLIARSPGCVDIVVDACQMRSEFDAFGAFVERGWMVQVSGSKFLTGPPFSGALVVPKDLRCRIEAVGPLLAAAPGIGRADDWTAYWASRLPHDPSLSPQSFGPIFRWFAALLEAQLLTRLPRTLRRWAFERFRTAVVERLAESEWLRPIDLDSEGDPGGDQTDDLSRLSIVSFQVLVNGPGGTKSALDEASCRTIFNLLNSDVADRLGQLSAGERVLASQQSHIGQPVALKTGQGPIAILRMVLGARFFTIVGHAGPGSIEAALESEISDALRAIGKLELLASRWWLVEQNGNERL